MLPIGSIGFIAGCAILPVWLALSWLLSMRHRQDYRLLIRHAAIGLFVYFLSLSLPLIFWLKLFPQLFSYIAPTALTTPAYTLSPGFWPSCYLAVAAVILIGASAAALCGWAVSSGGMRFIFLPLALLFRRWPPKMEMTLPVPPEQAVPWDSSSRKMALFISVLTVIKYGAIFYSIYWVIHLR